MTKFLLIVLLLMAAFWIGRMSASHKEEHKNRKQIPHTDKESNMPIIDVETSKEDE